MDLSRRALALLPAGLLAGCAVRTSSGPGGAARAAARASDLPVPVTGGQVALEEAIARRRSVRSFTGAPLTREHLGQLFWAAQGVTHSAGLRTAPSAGALYPLELYAATAGEVMHYLPTGHRMEQWTPTQGWQALLDATPSAQAVSSAGTAFVLAADIGRTASKYGGRSPLYVHLEAGHAAQNLLLQAVGLGLGAVTIGAFNEGRLSRFLALPATQEPLYLISVGHPK